MAVKLQLLWFTLCDKLLQGAGNEAEEDSKAVEESAEAGGHKTAFEKPMDPGVAGVEV
jgi:hypothetical protein